MTGEPWTHAIMLASKQWVSLKRSVLRFPRHAYTNHSKTSDLLCCCVVLTAGDAYSQEQLLRLRIWCELTACHALLLKADFDAATQEASLALAVGCRTLFHDCS